jgi:hypothetical protein
VYARFVLLLPRSSPADQTRWLTCQSRKQTTYPKKVGFKRNRTRPTTKYHPFLLPKKHTEAAGNDGWDFQYAEKKGGKSDPRVRFLVKECVSAFPPIIPSSSRENKANRKYVQVNLFAHDTRLFKRGFFIWMSQEACTTAEDE